MGSEAWVCSQECAIRRYAECACSQWGSPMWPLSSAIPAPGSWPRGLLGGPGCAPQYMSL